VPYNPLHDRGYPSIGCHPCTTAVREGEDDRAGRWRGLGKTECGLHARGKGASRSAPGASPRVVRPAPVIPLIPVAEEAQGV
jgi:3'-phosphoadenosine 5'-phosphosulfate sulfotransferase (PAPS reductase)/FAD synthetase